MRNKTIILLLVFIALSFCACGKNQNEDSITETTTQVQSLVSVSQPEGFTAIEFDTTNAVVASNADNTTQPEAPKNNSPVEQQAVKQAEINTVTLSVNCDNAVKNGILDRGTYSSVISADGIILAPSVVEITDGESAVSVLKRALKQSGLSYTITSSGYIKTINGLSEFDCGETSGWLYAVNGVKPSVSAKSYQLHNGDRLEIIYTCVQGDA